MTKFVRWVNHDGVYSGVADTATVEQLPPGVYDLMSVNGIVFFCPVDIRTEELLRFPGTPIAEVVDEIGVFWTREALFRSHDLPYKRGILLYGPPGSGKSCTLQLIARDVVERQGIVIQFSSPDLFISGYRIFRSIQPETPLVVLMEDLDMILDKHNETKVLNLLDGVERVDRVLFLATTNHPEHLADRVANRPSRFDRRYKVPHPNADARRMYFEALMRPGDELDLDKWVTDTDGLSLAHLKELFISVFILGGDYKRSLRILRKMYERSSSFEDSEEFEKHQYI